MKRTRWNMFNISNAAVGCNSRSEFARVNQSAYNAAKRLGFLDILFPIFQKQPMSREELATEASKYASRYAFRVGNYTAWKAAKDLDILDEILPVKRAAPAHRNNPLRDLLDEINPDRKKWR